MKLKLSDEWYRARAKAETRCLDVAAGMSLSKPVKNPTGPKVKKTTAARKVVSKANKTSRTRGK